MSGPRLGRAAGLALAGFVLTLGLGSVGAKALPVQTGLSAAAEPASGLDKVQYRDWERERAWRYGERRRAWERERRFRRYEHRRREWEWRRRHSFY